MIRINLLTPEQAKLAAAVAKFHRSQYNRPVSERHPELGRMINCSVCSRRHRLSIKCEQQFAINEKTKEVMMAPKTRKGIMGAAAFARKRFRPHRSSFQLQVLARARALFDAACDRAGLDWQPDMARYTRQAMQEVRAQREVLRRFKRRQQQVARGINFGLINPGTRPEA